MFLRETRKRPHSWEQHKADIDQAWTLPFHALEWVWQWTAYYLGRWAFLEVLEYLGSLSVLVAVVFYFSAAPDRTKQKHYQAWQVINTAQGKGGSGGRIEALQELNRDGVPLVGLDVSGAFLMGVRVPHADLRRCDMSGADLRESDFSGTDLESATLASANLRRATLRRTKLRNADLQNADLATADLTGADLSGADLGDADLHNADLAGVLWQNLKSVENANIFGVRNAPAGFVAWALTRKAVATPPAED